MPTKPTSTYPSLDAAYTHFNKKLFNGQLPRCLITFQRHKGALGYFSGGRFANLDNTKDVTDEIALNPNHFSERTPTKILSTLVHEMVHLWQHHFGSPSRTGYHNKEWAAKMESIGLKASRTGQIGDRSTGQHMSHYIIPHGPFQRACTSYLRNKRVILYQDLAGEEEKVARKKKANSKTKYTCPTCKLNAWAKPEAPLVCGECDEPMEAQEPEEGEEDES